MIEARDFTREQLIEYGAHSSAFSVEHRVAIVENWYLRAARNQRLFEWIEDACEGLHQESPQVNMLRSFKKSAFENKLRKVADKVATTGTFEYPTTSEYMFSADRLNKGLQDSDEDDLCLPTVISKEELINLARLRYASESRVLDNVIVGYTDKVLGLWLSGEIPPANLQCVLRDGRIFYASICGLLEESRGRKGLSGLPGTIDSSHLNRAVGFAIATNKQEIDYEGKPGITSEVALGYLEEQGIVGSSSTTAPLTIFLDSGSLGSVLKATKEGIGDRGKIAAIYLTAENPNIPAYIPFIETGTWYTDPGNPLLSRKQQIVRDYTEDHFGVYCHRPEEIWVNPRNDKFTLPVKLPNLASTILSWTSYQAAKDVGALFGLMNSLNDQSKDVLPAKSLDFLYAWWTKSVADPSFPNIAFTNWPKWSGGDSIIRSWRPGILEDLGLR